MAQQSSNNRRQAARHRDAVEDWLNAQASLNPRAAYRCDLEAFGAWCARHGALPLTADTATLVAFQAARQVAGDSDSTIRRRWSALSSFYDYAIERELRATNPTVGVDRPRLPSGDPSPTVQLSEAAVAGYRATAAALDPRLEALVALLVIDGLKVGEALALDIDDVTGRPHATTITVRRRGQTKRLVLDGDSGRAVRRCIGKRRTGPVFVNERSSKSHTPSRLTRFGADYLIKQIAHAAGLPSTISGNTLRRRYVIDAHARGTDLEEIRHNVGHSAQRTTRRYVSSGSDR